MHLSGRIFSRPIPLGALVLFYHYKTAKAEANNAVAIPERNRT